MLDAISTNAATALLVLLKPPLSKHESPLESDMNTETTSSTQYRVMKYENRRGRYRRSTFAPFEVLLLTWRAL